MIPRPTQHEMERAVHRRDTSYDGVFVLAVRTTGVFCRPSCPARKPNPRNVEYFATARDALFSGYRPCKRCRPMHTNGRPPGWVARLLAAVERAPPQRLTDADLRAMSIEPSRARRYFQRQFGMTFQAYHRARRMGTALGQIRDGADLLDVALGHGYESDSGFRDAFKRTFGRPPGRSRDSDCVVTTMMESPVGPLLLGATAGAVCLLEFTERRALERQCAGLRRRFGCAIVPGRNEMMARLTEELSRYFAGTIREFTVPLSYPGTPFQTAVWRRLLRIPYGETISYERLARDAGRPGAQRAAGNANGANRIAIIIPCHRVIQKDGRLGGYGGGTWRKQFLLDHERAVLARGNGRAGTS